MQNFGTQTIGFHHIPHVDLVSQHITPLAKTLFSQHKNEAAIIVLDCAYVYIHKSAEYAFQLMSLSMHKHRPLLKPMVMVIFNPYWDHIMQETIMLQSPST